jgi:hypothetical protein
MFAHLICTLPQKYASSELNVLTNGDAELH